jgi:hypothetical protein
VSFYARITNQTPRFVVQTSNILRLFGNFDRFGSRTDQTANNQRSQNDRSTPKADVKSTATPSPLTPQVPNSPYNFIQSNERACGSTIEGAESYLATSLRGTATSYSRPTNACNILQQNCDQRPRHKNPQPPVLSTCVFMARYK